jgi:hypothetical protein
MAELPTGLQKLSKTGRRVRAAALLAADELSDEKIAAEVGVSRVALGKWKHDPDFQQLIRESVNRIQASALKYPIAKKHKRIAALDDMHRRALQVIDDRAERYAGRIADHDSATAATRRLFATDVPAEAATGLLVETEKVNNAGMRTTEWNVDVGLMKEIRGIHEQAAKELGQWVEKSESNGTMTTVVQIIGPEE